MPSAQNYSPEFHRFRNPKAYPLHYDGWQYYPDQNAPQVALAESYSAGIQEVVDALGDNPYPQPRYKHLYRKIRAEFNDPITMYALLDLMVVSQRGIYLRSNYLTTLLNQQWPQYVWSHQVIGRIMYALCSHIEKMYPEAPEHGRPIDRGRDTKGHYLVIDPKGGNEGLLWLIRARDLFLKESERLMLREAVVQANALDQSLYDKPLPEEVFALIASFRIRSVGNYEASWRPDIPLGPTTSTRKPLRSPFGD